MADLSNEQIIDLSKQFKIVKVDTAMWKVDGRLEPKAIRADLDDEQLLAFARQVTAAKDARIAELEADIAWQRSVTDAARQTQAGLLQRADNLEAQLADLRSASAAVVTHFNRDPGQAPSHSHQVPGVWDMSNGPGLAGKPCTWCATWTRFTALVMAPGDLPDTEGGSCD